MVDETQEQIQSIREPIETASRFYTYYYLSEVEDVEAFDFDMDKLAGLLHEGFYKYGIYAIYKELENLSGMSSIDSRIVKEVIEENGIRTRDDIDVDKITPFDLKSVVRGEQAREVVIQESLQKATESKIKNMGFIHSIVEGQSTNTPTTLSMAVNIITDIMDEIYASTDFETFLHDAEVLFDELDWVGNFGGDDWAGIARAMSKREEMTKVAWVDMMWSLQHNTGTWINKVTWDVSTEYVKDAIDELPEREKEIMKERALEYKETMTRVKIEEVLDFILDQKKEGNFKNIYPFAVGADSRIRRYERELV